jgi:hypothetical protein
MQLRYATTPLLLVMLMLLAWQAQAAEVAPPQTQILDALDDISPWETLASDGVAASVHEARGVQGGALVLEFDLNKTAGYAAASRPLPLTLPENYELSFWIRGEAGRNNFELKLVDASGFNVWWFRRANFVFTGDWQQLRIKRRQIEFAWGPTSDQVLREAASLEFVVSAGRDGGKGNLWFDQIALTPLPPAAKAAPPKLSASSALPAHPVGASMDGKVGTAWRSAPNREPQSMLIDLQAIREFGGLEIDWLTGAHASAYSIAASSDGRDWRVLKEVDGGNGGRDSHLLPESEARYLRLDLPGAVRGYGIAEVHVRDLQFGASPNAFVESLAKRARRGCYPRGFVGEQVYWTIVGSDGDPEESLMSEDGAIEARRGGFSVEPFVRGAKQWLTWADVDIQHALRGGYLPEPQALWRHADFELEITARALRSENAVWTRASYRLRNRSASARRLTLALAIRPIQVNPPTQFLNTTGGMSQIRELAFGGGVVSVDGMPSVFARGTPRSFVTAPLDAGTPCEWLGNSARAGQLRDANGFASGALLYDLDLPPRGEAEVVLDLPLHPQPTLADEFATTPPSEWPEKLDRVELSLPAEARSWSDSLRTSLAHVLINRDGAALQPGSRAYERSWIRDGALTSQLLLRLGHADAVRDFLRWYATHLFNNGKTPCCVDRRGADPVPENDSPGEFLFLIYETYRYTNDLALLREMWPHAQAVLGYLEKLRQSERTVENTTPERRMFYGLLPESISHEGYAAKPMHSYWDDFWALAGYEAAVGMATVLQEKSAIQSLIAARDEFRADLYRSLQLSMRTHGIDYLPGAAELGDFDATSTTIALDPVGEQQMLPPDALRATFERYWREFEKRRTSRSWDAYTPYEWRVVGSFVRLGWRERALEAVRYFMADRRPTAWNQWAEVVGREVRRPRFIGDMPHGWVASDFGRALLDMFAYERPADESLLLMAGVPREWLRQESFAVRGLRTPYGELSYSWQVSGERRTLRIEPLVRMPAGGVVIAWPEGEPQPQQQKLASGTARWLAGELRATELPLTISFSR